jgi:DNA invertase Pin-like site-specific DNA recombinase
VMAIDPKIQADHLRRQAVVYVRQSTVQQVRGNRESTVRQYALAERARALGWPVDRVQTIDDDQGRSGAHADHRHGFKKLLAEIGAGQVGVVLALEASRLARSSADWHRLVEICVVTKTLLADESSVYDPRIPNDRLLLGLKGTLSEAELMTIRCRLHEGRWSKARRGELAQSLPVGYVRAEAGAVVKHPDRQVQARLGRVFDLFAESRVARRVVLRLRQEELMIPTQAWGGPGHGEVRWKVPTFGAIVRILHNPAYAGAYVYGQKEYDGFDHSAANGKARTKTRPLADWPVCVRDIYPAYITWDQFVQNQQAMRDNWFRHESRGAPRRGAALLQGIVHCGRCGARMRMFHYSTREKTCQMMSSAPIDAAVAERFLAAVTPAQVDVALRALEAFEAEQAEVRRQRGMQTEQAEYEVEIARRRYEKADPANRLVAAELEARWEQALRERERLRREAEEFERKQASPLGAAERRRIRAMATDLAKVWNAATTGMADRKELLRFLVHRVYLDGVTEPGQIRVTMEWHTGARTTLTVPRLAVGSHPRVAADARVRGDRREAERGRISDCQGPAVQLLFGGLHRPKPRLRPSRKEGIAGRCIIPVPYEMELCSPRTSLSECSVGSNRPSASPSSTRKRAHSSKSWCQSLHDRARRLISRPRINPT